MDNNLYLKESLVLLERYSKHFLNIARMGLFIQLNITYNIM